MKNGSDTPNRRLTHWRRLLKREAQRLMTRPPAPPSRNLRLSLFNPRIIAQLPSEPFDSRDFERRALLFALEPLSEAGSFAGIAQRRASAMLLFAELFNELIHPSGRLRLSELIASENCVGVTDRFDPLTGDPRPPFSLNAITALLEPFAPMSSSDSWSQIILPVCHGLAEALGREPQARLLEFWKRLCESLHANGVDALGLTDATQWPRPHSELLFLMGVLTSNETFRTALLLPGAKELQERSDPLAISALHEVIPALATAAIAAPNSCVSMATALLDCAERLGLSPAAPLRRFLSGELREFSLARKVIDALIMREYRGANSSSLDQAQDAFARLLLRHGADLFPHEVDPELGNPLSGRALNFSCLLRSYKEASAIQSALGGNGVEASTPRSRL